MAYLIHENDKKFSLSFDTVFSSERIGIVHTPFQAPRANAFAERWVRSIREECLDHILILNESRLSRVLKEYAEYYYHARPHHLYLRNAGRASIKAFLCLGQSGA